MNNVSLVGRLCRDVEVRYSQSATPVAVARTSIAVNRRFKKQGEADADFINILAFGKTAELLEKHFHKGKEIGVMGHIQTGSYENQEKKKVYTFEVVVDGITFVGSKGDGAGNTNTTGEVNNSDDSDDLPF